LDNDYVGHAQEKGTLSRRHHGSAAQVNEIAVGRAGKDP
jgi:hypothetical protein